MTTHSLHSSMNVRLRANLSSSSERPFQSVAPTISSIPPLAPSISSQTVDPLSWRRCARRRGWPSPDLLRSMLERGFQLPSTHPLSSLAFGLLPTSSHQNISCFYGHRPSDSYISPMFIALIPCLFVAIILYSFFSNSTVANPLFGRSYLVSPHVTCPFTGKATASDGFYKLHRCQCPTTTRQNLATGSSSSSSLSVPRYRHPPHTT